MAWLASVKLHSFPVPPRVLPTQRGPHLKTPAQRVVSNLRPKRVANLLLCACTSKQTTALSQDRFHVAVSSRQQFTPVSKLFRVSYSPRTLIGYWVGPDSEDGWGFAVAFIDEIL